MAEEKAVGNRKNLSDMTLEEMRVWFLSLGEKRFRADQVYRWIYQGAGSFDEMKNLPVNLRKKLAVTARLAVPHIVQVQRAADGTRKYLFRLEDDNCIESVFMKYHYGNAICVSSQAGCRMGCAFCASTREGLARNLSAGEMAGQVLAAQRETGERIGHIVVMGSGEPFENYDALARFLRLLHAKEALGISMRHITVSTCGLVPGIHRFVRDFPQVNLAISLHAPTDALRSRLMPVNRKYPLTELMAACEDYMAQTGRRITFEYALMKGINDRDEDIDRLLALLAGKRAHVNLIPLNAVRESAFSGSSRTRAREICQILEDHGIPATVRRRLGSEIDAACGQLRLSRKRS